MKKYLLLAIDEDGGNGDPNAMYNLGLYHQPFEVSPQLAGIYYREVNPKLMKKYNSKVVLCINEMDNLIGAKTSVTTSTAFHTNAGISQILRSLDTFKGIIVGTLNELSPERCEPAAIRRFQYLINFTLPDFEARKLIWASREGFWQQNPTLINRLAQFELSGSDIHSVCEKGFFLVI